MNHWYSAVAVGALLGAVVGLGVPYLLLMYGGDPVFPSF